ncbi:MAG: GTP pyrophosphokinase family protein [Acutalibacteraceae bacterium]
MTDLIGTDELCFYGDKLPAFQAVISEITEKAEESGYVEHIKYRIKSLKSIQAKLEKKGLEFTRENAFNNLYDLVGVRLICKYADEVDKIFSLFKDSSQFEIVRTKDYISNPKPNGYRSFHAVVRKEVDVAPERQSVFAEIQIRTISMDSWASLEHQLKYKKHIKDEAMIVSELKKCADEMYSSEISLMTLRDLINEN